MIQTSSNPVQTIYDARRDEFKSQQIRPSLGSDLVTRLYLSLSASEARKITNVNEKRFVPQQVWAAGGWRTVGKRAYWGGRFDGARWTLEPISGRFRLAITPDQI